MRIRLLMPCFISMLRPSFDHRSSPIAPPTRVSSSLMGRASLCRTLLLSCLCALGSASVGRAAGPPAKPAESSAPGAASKAPEQAPQEAPQEAKKDGAPESTGTQAGPSAEAKPAASAQAGAEAAAQQPAPALPEFEVVKGEALGVELTVQHFTLANGLRVYVVEDHSVPVFALNIGYGVGSRDEEEGRTGFAHLFEHMMFKGSENVPDGGILRYVSGSGGEVNAFTTPDFTMYFDVLPSHHLEPILWMEADRMRSLEVTDANFENQRSAVLEEMAMRYDNAPYARGFIDFLAKVWEGTVYGHMPIGSKEDLLAATADDARAFFEKHYVPSNAVLAVVGDVTPQKVREYVMQYFGDIPGGEPTAAIDPIDHTQTSLVEVYDDPLARQPVFALGWKTVPKDHPDRHALELLFDILVRGDSSKITKILVDDEKLAIASVPMGSGGGRDAGSEFAAFVPVQGVSFDQILAVVDEQIAKIKKRGVSSKDLQKAINQRTVSTIEELASNDSRALRVALGALQEGDPLYVLEDLKKTQAVKVADIKRVANEYLSDKTLRLEIRPAQ